MLDDIPFGQTPIGKSKYAFDDFPHLSNQRWSKIEGEYHDDGIEISYIGNSKGYRCKEFSEIDWHNSIVFLGDSATYGHGVTEINSIPKIVEKEIGIECINLAIPGASSELLIAISCVLINEVSPNKIVLGHPSMPRIWDPIGSTGNLGPWLDYAKGFAKESYELYYCWTKVKDRLKHKCLTNTLTLRTLWKNQKVFEWAWNKEVADLINVPHYEYFDQPAENLSRDGYHANKKIHTIIAREIINAFR